MRVTSDHVRPGPHTSGGLSFASDESQQVPQSHPMRMSELHGSPRASAQVPSRQWPSHEVPLVVVGAVVTVTLVSPSAMRALLRASGEARMPPESVALTEAATVASATAIEALTKTEAAVRWIRTTLTGTLAAVAIARRMVFCSAGP